MVNIYLLRGNSGSGKSTWTKTVPNAVVFSADHYFINDEQKYVFDANKLGEAHNECFTNYVDFLTMHAEDHFFGDPEINIVVDNTNIRLHELSPYVSVAKMLVPKNILNLKIMEFRTPPAIAHPRNVHGVPFKTVERQFNSFELVPKYWDIQVETFKE